MKYNLIVFSGLLVLLTAVFQPTFSQTTPQAAIETITITPSRNELQTEVSIEAPFAFNAVVPSWIAAGEAPEIHLRTSPDGQVWSDWFHVHAHDDWTLPGEAETIGDMIVVPAADNTHRFLQYDIHLEADATQLSALSFTFIDTTDGPTITEMLQQQQILDARRPASVDSYPRPPVISRQVWCTYDTCDDIVDLEYAPATHLIVHHTVSGNSSANWAATVRAIYIYHRDTRGWGDIGYNYLVDRTGVIYEGHMNEDYFNLDVVGVHAGGANAGSLGTALIGTFTNADEYGTYDVPPPAMMNAVANLFAWKADQRDIEIYDASRPVNMTWGLPHIMGHRDVYGGTNTLCPGGNAHDLLPWLRTAVTGRLGQVSPYTFISEESTAFTKSNNNWYETPGGCGWQGHAYYTWSTTNPAESTNWGQWRLNAPAAGLYEIQVYAPYCDTNNAETRGAAYTINNGVTTQTAVVSHLDNIGLWMSLGAYQLAAGNNTLRLTDLTTTDSGVGVWFDDVRFKPVTDVALNNVSPTHNSWQTQPTVTFNWTIDNPSLVQATTLQVATDAAFTNIIATKNWATAVTSAQHTFSQDYANLYWRVSANTGGTTFFSTSTRFGLDATAPESSITTLMHHAYRGAFDVTWSGSDATSGIAGYNVDYKVEGSAVWTRWLSDTLATSGVFTPTNAAALIWFRSQAADVAGNLETESSGDMRSDQAVIVFNPGAANTSPLSGWTNNPNVLFAWTLTEINAVTNSTVTVATDAAFNNVVASGQTNSGATSHALSLPTNDGSLYWRVAVDFTPTLPGLTSTVTSGASLFGLDTTPPTSTVTAVYTLTHSLYMITTTGADAHAGVNQINLEYQAEGNTEWIPLSGIIFSPPIPGHTYYFRSQATDHAGNIEPPHATADANTNQAKPVPHAIMLPVVTK